MKKIVLFLLVIIFSVYANGYPKELEISSVVIDTHPEYDFFIIDAGTLQGIEMGDGLIVYRDDEKIGDAYIIEVRTNVSAAEILHLQNGKKVQEGDQILIVKEKKEERHKRTTSHYKNSGEIRKPVGSNIKTPSKQRHARRGEPRITKQDEIIAKIENDPQVVFSYAQLILQEHGYLIISSNRSAGVMLAKKPIALSILSELWADATAAIGHSLVASFDIKGSTASSTLRVLSFKEHSQKEKYIKTPLRKNSVFYNELSDIVFKIKERSEH